MKHGKGKIVIASNFITNQIIKVPYLQIQIKRKNIQVILKMIKCVEKEYISIKLEQYIVDNLRKIDIMDLVFTNFLRDAHMRVNGFIIKCMVKVYLLIRKEIDGKGSL